MSLRQIFRSIQRNSGYLVFLFFLLIFYCLIFLYNHEKKHHKTLSNIRRFHWDLSQIGIKNYPTLKSYERRDWHNYEFMKYEAARKGIGEQGEGYRLTDAAEIEVSNKLGQEEGLNVIVSDKISINRSVPDTRPQECLHKKYLKLLPSTSIIVIFYNEWPSILKRTLHSIYNRTPMELLKEIILVNDNSTKPELYDQFELYLRENFNDRVKVKRLEERRGLIVARMEGAKIATGEVLVFLDAHMEVNVNWLPPLLEPIVISPTIVTTPTMDYLFPATFQYGFMNGTRGVFDDLMWYQWLPLRGIESKIYPEPYRIPIMLGAGFAIRRDYFKDLGQYDEGLKIWNGEQIELSLKLHLCGGDLLEVPCSRVAHTFRTNQKNHKLDGIDVAARNFKRIAEVWLDEYKEVMYRTDPKFNLSDAGDLTIPKLVKQKLNCKPFHYFLDKIAPEMYTRYYYQLDYPGHFAVGAVKSDALPTHCLEYNVFTKAIDLFKCRHWGKKNPKWSQKMRLTWHKKLRHHEKDVCLQENLAYGVCQYSEGVDNQNWKYDINTKQLIYQYSQHLCLTISIENKMLSLKACNETDVNQKWTWSSFNDTALRNFDKIKFEFNTVVGL